MLNEYFKTILGDAPKDDLMDGVNTTWERVKNGSEIGLDIAGIRKNFDVEHTDKSVPALVKLLDKVEKVNDNYWKEQKTKELSELIAACAGLWFESYAAEPVYAIGDSVKVKTQVILRSNVYAYLNKITYPGHMGIVPTTYFTKKDTLKNILRDFE